MPKHDYSNQKSSHYLPAEFLSERINPERDKTILLTNISGQNSAAVSALLPDNLQAIEVVAFPDLCPAPSAPLPTGVAVRLNRRDWRQFAVSDCGCGMLLLRSSLSLSEFSEQQFYKLGQYMKSQKGGLGDLGGGNHFVDALVSYKDEKIYFLIHTGSRNESGIVDGLVNYPEAFDQKYGEVVAWAEKNRSTIAGYAARYFGELETVLDKAHNTIERINGNEVIIRKGTAGLKADEVTIIPSSLTGEAALVKGNSNISKVLNSMSHGTGRALARSETKSLAELYDFSELRRSVYIPDYISDMSLRSEIPLAYRPIEHTLSNISGYVNLLDRFSVVAYLGHL